MGKVGWAGLDGQGGCRLGTRARSVTCTGIGQVDEVGQVCKPVKMRLHLPT